MPEAPQISDFPSNLQQSVLITSPPGPRSLLILLHGLGDTNTPLSNLGKQLNLPHTACLSIKGPQPIPALFMGTNSTGWHWGDDIQVDNTTGELELDTGLEAASKILGGVLKVMLGEDGEGFEPRNIFLWGFGQGGMVALSLAEAFATELGGVVAIGGKPPASKLAMRKAIEIIGPGISTETKAGRAKTPVLLCGGNRHTTVTSNALRDTKERFETVEYVKWGREGDSMARNREEMLPIMKFLARRLRMSAPVGTEEVGGVSRA